MSKPIKEKASTDFENELLKCGASSMQGWRMSQEDAHNCCMDFDEGISLFAVYDGHGGHEVAEYAAEHLPGFIKKSEPYGKGDYQNALIDAFLDFDATLKTEPVMEELAKIAKSGKSGKDGEGAGGEEEEDEEEAGVQTLREEASMPLAEVIAMYTSGSLPKTPRNKLLGGPSKVLSPFLRAKAAAGSSSSSNDNGVSSSSGSPPSSLVNGAPEKACDSSEQEASEAKAGESKKAPEESSGQPTKSEEGSSNGEVASSSTSPDPQVSSTNEEAQPPTSSSSEKPKTESGGPSKVGDLTASLLEGSFASDEEDSSDETFQANEDGASSSSEDVHLNGSKDSEDDDEEGDEELEEESEEEEEEDEDEDYADGELIGMKAGPEEPAMDSGCTAVVALVTKEKIFVANAGDSRAILSRNGVAVDLSVDHKPEDPAELKRIQNAGGKVIRDGRVNGGLNLSRALGDHCYKKSADLDAREQMITALPDVVTENIDRSVDEFIVLACDGIWNSMTSQEVVDFVRPLIQKGETLSSICEKLFDACLAPDTMGDGTGCDNMTCVIVRLNSPSDTPSSKRPLPAETTDSPQDSKKVKLTEES